MSRKNEELIEEANSLFEGNDEVTEAAQINAIMGADADIQKAPRMKIILHNQEGVDGDKPVFVAVNGVGFSIPREEPVLVPKPVVVALENASETKFYREEVDGQAHGPVLSKNVRRFPFSIIS